MFSSKLFIFLCVLHLVAPPCVAWELDDEMNGVVEVGHKTGLQDIVGGQNAVFLVVYAPWCEYSRGAVAGLRGFRKPGVTFAKLNGEFHGEAALMLGTTQYPQMLFFAPGDRSPTEQYQGGATVDDIDEYISRKLGVQRGGGETKLHIAILTEKNFEKAVGFEGRTTFVQFLTKSSEKAQEVASWYESVASAFENDDSVLVAAVDMETNKKLSSKYHLDGSKSPYFMLFVPGKEKPVPFRGDPTPKTVMNFLNKFVQTTRNIDGSLTQTAGLIGAVHSIAAGGKVADPDTLQAALSAVEELLEKDPSHAHAGLYKKILVKVGSKGVGWIGQEINRLEKMIAKGDVKGAKKELFTKRVNILKSLAPQ